MSKSDYTGVELEASLQRILSGKPTSISNHRKLSVRAVEEEANLGDGSAYYYKELVQKIKKEIQKQKSQPNRSEEVEKITRLKEQLKNESRLKNQYRNQVEEQKRQLSAMAAIHNQLTLQAQVYIDKITELESHNTIKMNRN
jgi:hypothetical protein